MAAAATGCRQATESSAALLCPQDKKNNIRNMSVIAHVDHGEAHAQEMPGSRHVPGCNGAGKGSARARAPAAPPPDKHHHLLLLLLLLLVLLHLLAGKSTLTDSLVAAAGIMAVEQVRSARLNGNTSKDRDQRRWAGFAWPIGPRARVERRRIY